MEKLQQEEESGNTDEQIKQSCERNLFLKKQDRNKSLF